MKECNNNTKNIKHFLDACDCYGLLKETKGTQKMCEAFEAFYEVSRIDHFDVSLPLLHGTELILHEAFCFAFKIVTSWSIY